MWSLIKLNEYPSGLGLSPPWRFKNGSHCVCFHVSVLVTHKLSWNILSPLRLPSTTEAPQLQLAHWSDLGRWACAIRCLTLQSWIRPPQWNSAPSWMLHPGTSRTLALQTQILFLYPKLSSEFWALLGQVGKVKRCKWMTPCILDLLLSRMHRAVVVN